MSEELKAIDWLRAKTISYESRSEELHYALILYNLIMNLQEENEELKKQLEEHNLAIENLAYWKGKNESKMKINRLRRENQELKKQLEVGKEQYNDLVEEKEKIQEQLSSNTLQFENQQKEFIEWLESEKDRLAKECSHTYEDSLGKTRLVNKDIYNEVSKILSKIEKSDK